MLGCQSDNASVPFLCWRNSELVCDCSFFFSSQCLKPLCSSFLLLFILFAIWLVSFLGGQGSHGIADGFVVWVNTRQVLQDALKELWVLHHIIVIFLLFNYIRGYDQLGCIRLFNTAIFTRSKILVVLRSMCVCTVCIVCDTQTLSIWCVKWRGHWFKKYFYHCTFFNCTVVFSWHPPFHRTLIQTVI